MSTEDDNPSLTDEHPLLKSQILENIFDKEKWTIDELKCFRCVCPIWYDATLNIWNTTACIVLNGSETKVSKNIASVSKVFKRYVDYREDTSVNWTLKYKTMCNYKLVKCRVDETNKDVKSFLETFAPHMKHLSMQECLFKKPSTFESIVYTLALNVECLVLNSNRLSWLPLGSEDDDDEGGKKGGSTPEEEGSDEDNEGGRVTRSSTAKKRQVKRVYHLNTEDFTPLENPFKIVQSKLKSLHIENETYLTQKITLESFFAHFPNLEELKIKGLQNSPKSLETPTEDFWRALYIVRRANKSRLRIKKLDVMHLSTDAIYMFGRPDTTDQRGAISRVRDHGGSRVDIGDSALPLTHLTIDISYTGEEYLNYVVKSHAKTLQVLKLFRAPYSITDVELPTYHVKLLALKELHLFGGLATDFCFLQTMPNLRILRIERWCYTKRDKLSKLLSDEEAKPTKNMNHLLVKRSLKKTVERDTPFTVEMKHLEEFDMDQEFDSHSISQLAKWMPKLKILRLILTNKSLAAVVKGWPELTELTLKFESCVDDDGIHRLVKLKQLRKFKLEAHCNKGRLGDRSMETFEGMSHGSLTDLEICVSDQMREDGVRLKRVISNLRNAKIIRNYGKGDHEYECCSRVQFYDATRANDYKCRAPVIVPVVTLD